VGGGRRAAGHAVGGRRLGAQRRRHPTPHHSPRSPARPLHAAPHLADAPEERRRPLALAAGLRSDRRLARDVGQGRGGRRGVPLERPAATAHARCAGARRARRAAPRRRPRRERPFCPPRPLPLTACAASMRSTGAGHWPREYWKCFTSSPTTAGSSACEACTPRLAFTLYTLGGRRGGRRDMAPPPDRAARAARGARCVGPASAIRAISTALLRGLCAVVLHQM
jgi:hypothetical protein